MSLEENKAIVRNLYEAFNKHDVALLDNLIVPDFVDHTMQLRGLDSFKKIRDWLHQKFPRLL